MNIGLIAHDAKKTLLQNLCIAYRSVLAKHTLYATGTSGRLVEEVTNLTIHKYLAGHLGGEKQLGAQIENNELDLVLTKGFQSLIVECKARSKLDQNFYFKLNSLVDMFGVGAHKVLLTTANTEDNDDNRMQRERGNMMGITTISEIEEIQDIAETLMALLQ